MHAPTRTVEYVRPRALVLMRRSDVASYNGTPRHTTFYDVAWRDLLYRLRARVASPGTRTRHWARVRIISLSKDTIAHG